MASRCYRGQKCKRAERTHLGGRRDNRGHPSWWFFRLELRAPLVDAVLFQIAVRQFSPRFSVRSSVWRGYRSGRVTNHIWLRPRHRSGLTGLGGLIVGGNRVRSLMLLAASYFFRSEEHTSELQSLMRISYAVFCLKNKIT